MKISKIIIQCFLWFSVSSFFVAGKYPIIVRTSCTALADHAVSNAHNKFNAPSISEWIGTITPHNRSQHEKRNKKVNTSTACIQSNTASAPACYSAIIFVQKRKKKSKPENGEIIRNELWEFIEVWMNDRRSSSGNNSNKTVVIQSIMWPNYFRIGIALNRIKLCRNRQCLCSSTTSSHDLMHNNSDNNIWLRIRA